MKDEDWKEFIAKEMEKSLDEVMAEIEADPKMKDVKPPKGMYDNVMAMIHEHERQKLYEQLSDEDKAASKESIGQIMSSLSEAQLEKTGLTEEIVTKVWNKTAISYNYTNNLIEGFDIDDEKIRAGINKSDYKQYDTQSLFISTMKYDEEGKSSEMTDKEKSEAKNKIEALLDKAKAGDDFSTLVTDNEDVTSTDRSFFIRNSEAIYVSL